MEIKALSLWQPWALLMTQCWCDGRPRKSIETRHWPTTYRGPIAIHAAKKWARELEELCESWPFGDVLSTSMIEDIDRGVLRGCVLGIGELWDCKQVTPELGAYVERRLTYANTHEIPCEYHWGDFTEGRFMWFVRNMQEIDPVPLVGRQGLFDWEVPDQLEELVREICAAHESVAVAGGVR